MRVIQLNTTVSTNLDAKRLAGSADFGPVWILADEQTGGRGRQGRSWVSPVGNFYGSYLFPTEQPAAMRSLYSFAIALGLYDALKSLSPDGDFKLKWPNDVLLGNAKLAGMLLETGQTHHQVWVIAGIGVNLVSSPKDTPYPAASLKDAASETIKPAEFLEILNSKTAYWVDKFDRSGFEPIREAWLKAASNIPGPVTVRLPDDSFSGDAIDLGKDGALQVRLANGTIRQVHAGDVFPG